MMGKILEFPVQDTIQDKSVEEKLTPELIKEYKETILMVNQMQDQIVDIEDWKMAYGMMLSFNHLLMKYISEEKE